MIKPDNVTVIRSWALIVTSTLMVILRFTNIYELRSGNVKIAFMKCYYVLIAFIFRYKIYCFYLINGILLGEKRNKITQRNDSSILLLLSEKAIRE